jgi:hypothetical protein
MAPTEWRPVRALRLHPVAAELLDVADKARRFPAEAHARVIEIMPDGTVVAGAREYLRARRAGRERVRVRVRDEWADEDAAFVAGEVLKDVLAGSNDPIAVGTASAAFRRFCAKAKRPRKGYPKTQYARRFRMGPAERLERIVADVFHLGDDQLRKLERVAALPVELHAALRAGAVTLRSLGELAGQPEALAAVAAEVRDGRSPAKAIAEHLVTRDERPEPRTALRRLLRAGAQAENDLGDRVAKIGFLRDDERAGLARTRELIDSLLGLATEAEVWAFVVRTHANAAGATSKSSSASPRSGSEPNAKTPGGATTTVRTNPPIAS